MTTFLQLKQQAVQGYRARQMVTGTTATAGTTTIIPDNNRQEPAGEWDRVDSFIKFNTITNVGTERRITGFSAGQSLVVSPALSASVGSGTSYQIFKTFTDSDAALAVNSSLRDTFPDRMIESIASAGETDGSYTVSVPSAAGNAMTQIVLVDRAVGSTNYSYFPLFEGSDYDIEENNNVFTLTKALVGASGAYLRFHYRRPSSELSADTDITDEPASLILAGARKWLAIMEGDPQSIERFGREFLNAKNDYTKNREARRLKTPIFGVNNASF